MLSLECSEAVLGMKNNKSPGIDGLPIEFYKMFWKSIRYFLIEALSQIYTDEELTSTQKCSVLSLIHKKGEVDKLENYRPISLTNCDYKIIAFVFARRLQKVIDNLISRNQSGYIKGRYIGNNARLILDILDYCENTNTDGILLFADFQKAFDSIEWNFLFKTLEKFNFGDKFIKWIKILYTNPNFCIKNNGWISRKCKMQRGIRQGCPVSALLFLFAMEVLNEKINSSTLVKGFKHEMMENEIKCIQHADDSTFPLKDKTSLMNAIQIIEKFGNISGTKLNLSKTECILLGELKNIFQDKTSIGNVKINLNAVKCLGIYIGHNKKECNEKNWLCKLKEFEKILDSWRSRRLTIFGKCQIINSLIVSKLLYVATILENPNQDIVKKVNKIIFSFLWGKRERIKRKTLIRKIKDGGIGITDFETKVKALKASWVAKLVQKDSGLHWLLNACVGKVSLDIPYLLNTNITKTQEFNTKCLPQFYKEVICAFNECKENDQGKFQIQNIWFNRNITYKGKTLFFPNWIKSGYKYVKDLFNEQGFKTINEIKENLICSQNYLCEYMVVKSALKTYTPKLTMENKVTKINPQLTFNFQGRFEKIEGKKSKFFYNILLSKTSKKPLMERFWSELFCIDDLLVSWENIYLEKIKKIFDKNVSEFNFKLLHNLLTCNKYVNKWNKDLDKNCSNCNAEEDIKHLIFDCDIVKPIWSKISLLINIEVTWKIIVIGFPAYCSKNTFILNNILSFIAYKIYKYKMKCRILNENVTNVSLLCFLKNALAQFYLITKLAKSTECDLRIINELSEKL